MSILQLQMNDLRELQIQTLSPDDVTQHIHLPRTSEAVHERPGAGVHGLRGDLSRRLVACPSSAACIAPSLWKFWSDAAMQRGSKRARQSGGFQNLFEHFARTDDGRGCEHNGPLRLAV